MKFLETAIAGVKVIEPRLFGDSRGYFFEAYREDLFAGAGIDARFIQDNESFSTGGVLRGLHYQIPPYTQAKLVRVVSGRVLDVVVDIRLADVRKTRGDRTFRGEQTAVVPSARNGARFCGAFAGGGVRL